MEWQEKKTGEIDQYNVIWLSLQTELDKRLDGPARVCVLTLSKQNGIDAMAGILLSANVCVPLDCHSPEGRLRKIINDVQPAAIIIDQEAAELHPSTLSSFKTSRFGIGSLILLTFDEARSALSMPPDLALILYTSGSTGIPKGVMISHDNAMTFIRWASFAFPCSSTDVFSSIAPLHFDLSIFDVFMSYWFHATLQLYDPNVTKNPLLLASKLSKDKVSVLYATPTLLSLLLNHGKLEKYDFSALRYVLFAGEVFPFQSLKKLMSVWKHVSFFNLYGPTETNVCTFFPVHEEAQHPVPIGSACYVNTTSIEENSTQGELIVSGLGVSPGYWNNDVLNQSKFFTDKRSIRWYRTGDIVKKVGADYIYLGRNDRMVKRRGYRIELDEIEHVVSAHTEILSAAVISRTLQDEPVKIICYYQLQPENDMSLQQLRAFCLESLPLYMIPDSFIPLEQIPKTSTQKIDYQLLKQKVI